MSEDDQPTSPPPPPSDTITGDATPGPVDEVIFLPGGLDGVGASLDFDSERPGRPSRR